MKMAKEYADKLGPLEKWLDKTEKKIKEMETVPTEEDQIQRRIREHEKVHDDIIGKQPSFDDLADVASALMQVVGDKDAQALADKIEELTNKYAALVTNYDLPIAKNRNLILRKNIARKIDKTEALRKPNMEQPFPIKEVKILKTAEDIQERRE